MTKVGFVGLGNMGGPMAANLVKAGHEVTGFDLAPASLEAAEAAGIAIAGSAAAAVAEAEVVVSMLPAGPHVREVYLGEGGIADASPAGALLIDCSTIDVGTAKAVAAAAKAAGRDLLDAPVSGGVAGAEAGTLTFMVGGEAAAFARGKPLFEVMGRKVVHAGASGTGQAAKVCNNMILGITMIAVSEAFTLGEALGLDAQKLFEISSTASGSCWAMLNHHPVPGIVETSAANRGYKPGFAAAMMLKDLKLSQQAASEAGVATPLGAEAAALYTMLAKSPHRDLDYTAIIKLLGGLD